MLKFSRKELVYHSKLKTPDNSLYVSGMAKSQVLLPISVIIGRSAKGMSQ